MTASTPREIRWFVLSPIIRAASKLRTKRGRPTQASFSRHSRITTKLGDKRISTVNC
jgi:hypothetical protein